MTTKTTERDLIEEVEELLNDAGFCGDFESASRPLLRRLVEEVKRLRALHGNSNDVITPIFVCDSKQILNHLASVIEDQQQWLAWADNLTGNQHHLPSKMRQSIEALLEE